MDSVKYVYPSKIKLYTTVCCCSLNTLINLERLCAIVGKCLSEEDIISVRYKQTHIFIESLMNKKKKKKDKKKKSFYNQCTLIIKSNSGKSVNIKVFTNGNVQMTGCKDKTEINDVLKKLIAILKKKVISIKEKRAYCIVKDEDQIQITNMKIPLINTGFSTNFRIKRQVLFKMLIEKYQMFTVFDTDIHVGVRTRFISLNDSTVNITIFQTGSILIASNNFESIDEGYAVINEIFKENFEQIVKINKVIEIPDNLKNLKRLEYGQDTLFYVVKKEKNKNAVK